VVFNFKYLIMMKIIIIIIYSWISLPIILGYVCCEFSIFPSLVGFFLFELTHLVCYLSWSVGCLIFKFTQFLSFSKLVTNSPYKTRLVPKIHKEFHWVVENSFSLLPFLTCVDHSFSSSSPFSVPLELRVFLRP